MGKSENSDNGRRLLTVEQVAARLQLSSRTIYNRCAPKSKNPFPIRPKRIGKLLRFDTKDVDDYIASL